MAKSNTTNGAAAMPRFQTLAEFMIELQEDKTALEAGTADLEVQAQKSKKQAMQSRGYGQMLAGARMQENGKQIAGQIAGFSGKRLQIAAA
jgi:hypothetical protein